jgi:hypothetical protein
VASGEARQDRGDQGEQHRLERGDPQGAAHFGERGAQVGLRLLEPFQYRLGVLDQDAGLRGEPDSASGRLEQGHSRLGLQLAQLLGNRRRAIGQGPRHGGEGSAAVQLAQ